MKKNIYFTLIILLLIACNGKSRQNSATVLQSDSIAQIDDTTDDFNAFYARFISDSVFQKQHIVFPLKDAIVECNSVVTLTAQNWIFDSHDIRIYDKASDTLSIKQTQTQCHFTLERKETGILYEMKFEKRPQGWYLVYYLVNAC